MVTINELRKERKKDKKRIIDSGIKSFRKAILSYSKDRKESDITIYIVNFNGNLNFDYLFMNEKAKDSTIDMINFLENEQKISPSEKHSLEILTTNCYNGQNIRAQVRGQRYAERIRASTTYNDKIMSI